MYCLCSPYLPLIKLEWTHPLNICQDPFREKTWEVEFLMVPAESECVHVLAATLSREIIQDLWAKLAFFKRMWFRIQVPNLASSE